MLKVVAFVAAILIAAGMQTGFADEKEEVADVLEQIQGDWEQRLGKIRVEKHVDGNTETSIVFNELGEVVREQTSVFKIQKLGDFFVLSWKNAQVTGGAARGQRIPNGTIVFRLRDGKWHCAEGFSSDEFFSPSFGVWHRPEVREP